MESKINDESAFIIDVKYGVKDVFKGGAGSPMKREKVKKWNGNEINGVLIYD